VALDTILLDTSGYSAFKRGHDEVLLLVRAATTILVPAVVVGELLAGFEGGSRRDANRSDLQAFFNSPRVRAVPISRATAERYAVIYHYLRANGTPVPTNDLWIAAAAMEHGAAIVTLDAHFSLMPQVITAHLS
jgi:tRNA(fMet)-specific endonuclease VapC